MVVKNVKQFVETKPALNESVDGALSEIAQVLTESSQVLAPVFTKIVQFLDGRDWTRDNYIKQSTPTLKMLILLSKISKATCNS